MILLKIKKYQKMSNSILLTENLEPIINIVNDFSKSPLTQLTIPYEMTNRQRSVIYDMAKELNIYAKSYELSNSKNKKMMLKKTPFETLSQIFPDRDEIDMFSRFSGIPFPCPIQEYIEYYINLYDELFNVKRLYDLFIDDIQHLSFKKEVSDLCDKISDIIKSNKEYQIFLTQKYKQDDMIRIKDIYNISNIGKHFISIDIKSANFTMLRQYCPTIFKTSDGKLLSWQEFIQKLTKSKFLVESKYFRELCFGKIGFAKKSKVLQEIYMDNIQKKIDQLNLDLKIVIKCGDELVYQISDVELLLNQIDLIKKTIGDDIINLHLRVFSIDQITTHNYFIKKFIWTNEPHVPIEFKCVPKIFYPQLIKIYKKQPLCKIDLSFIYEGVLAEFTVPLS